VTSAEGRVKRRREGRGTGNKWQQILKAAYFCAILFALREEGAMPSNTKITELKRKRKKGNLGKKRKKAESKHSTRAFEIHVQKD
jgi:hypothetical protein